MALEPVLQISRIIEQRSFSGTSVGYFVILLIGFALWMATAQPPNLDWSFPTQSPRL
jgi:hypothetical protein